MCSIDLLLIRSIHRTGKSIVVDGKSLSIAAVVATARYSAGVALDDSPEARARVDKSRKVIVDAVAAARSVYGVSTGFGGSGMSFSSNTSIMYSDDQPSGHPYGQHHRAWPRPASASPHWHFALSTAHS